jgi:hypothetical protein
VLGIAYIHVPAKMMSDRRSCSIRQQGLAEHQLSEGTHCETSVCGQQLEAVLHVNELALDGSVVAAKVVERRIQLLQAQVPLNSQSGSTLNQLGDGKLSDSTARQWSKVFRARFLPAEGQGADLHQGDEEHCISNSQATISHTL